MTAQSVADFMTPSPYTCRPEDSLQRAAALMAEHDCGCLPVVDADRRVSGVLTDRDVCIAAARAQQSLDKLMVGQHMTRQVHTCAPDATLTEACELMRNHRVRRMVVTNPSGRLLGLLSLDDLAHARTQGAVDDHAIVDALSAASISRVYG